MKKFEYKQMTTLVDTDALNELGKLGWELINIDTEKKVYLFKRESLTGIQKYHQKHKDLLLENSYYHEE